MTGTTFYYMQQPDSVVQPQREAEVSAPEPVKADSNQAAATPVVRTKKAAEKPLSTPLVTLSTATQPIDSAFRDSLLANNPYYLSAPPKLAWVDSIENKYREPNEGKPIFIAHSGSEANLMKAPGYISITQYPLKPLVNISYTSAPWFVLSLVLVLSLFSLVKFYYNKYLIQVMATPFNPLVGDKLFQNRNAHVEKTFTILNWIFVLCTGIFTFQVTTHFNYVPDSVSRIQWFGLCILFIGTFFVWRILSNVVIGFLFDAKQIFNDYNHLILIFYKWIGVILIPFVIFFAYTPLFIRGVILFTALIIISLSIILRIYRSIRIISRKDLLLFYLILYLCTIEIIPLLILYKWLNGII